MIANVRYNIAAQNRATNLISKDIMYECSRACVHACWFVNHRSESIALMGEQKIIRVFEVFIFEEIYVEVLKYIYIYIGLQETLFLSRVESK